MKYDKNKIDRQICFVSVIGRTGNKKKDVGALILIYCYSITHNEQYEIYREQRQTGDLVGK